jgi:hypothetical protein
MNAAHLTKQSFPTYASLQSETISRTFLKSQDNPTIHPIRPHLSPSLRQPAPIRLPRGSMFSFSLPRSYIEFSAPRFTDFELRLFLWLFKDFFLPCPNAFLLEITIIYFITSVSWERRRTCSVASSAAVISCKTVAKQLVRVSLRFAIKLIGLVSILLKSQYCSSEWVHWQFTFYVSSQIVWADLGDLG